MALRVTLTALYTERLASLQCLLNSNWLNPAQVWHDRFCNRCNGCLTCSLFLSRSELTGYVLVVSHVLPTRSSSSCVDEADNRDNNVEMCATSLILSTSPNVVRMASVSARSTSKGFADFALAEQSWSFIPYPIVNNSLRCNSSIIAQCSRTTMRTRICFYYGLKGVI